MQCTIYILYLSLSHITHDLARLAEQLGLEDPRLIQSMVIFKQPNIWR